MPILEIQELVNNAKVMDIEVMPPNIKKMNKSFCLIGKLSHLWNHGDKGGGRFCLRQNDRVPKKEQILLSGDRLRLGDLFNRLRKMHKGRFI